MSKRILIVEDQEDLRTMLRDFLTAFGQTVIEPVDGAADVAKAASEHSRSHAQRHPAAHARRLRCSAADQGAAWLRSDPDRCGQSLCHEGGRREGCCVSSEALSVSRRRAGALLYQVS